MDCPQRLIRRFAACCLPLVLAGGCGTPVRLLKAPHSEPPAVALIAAADIHIWGRFGRQSLPLRQASLAASAVAREALAERLGDGECGAAPASKRTLDEALALFQRVATAWLADPSAARAGLAIGAGLGESAGACRTALILLGQQLPQPAAASNWLSLGALNVADGKLLRLAAVPIPDGEDLGSPEVLKRRTGQLLERLYR